MVPPVALVQVSGKVVASQAELRVTVVVGARAPKTVVHQVAVVVQLLLHMVVAVAV